MTAPATRLQDYVQCLWKNNTYSFMWLAECTKQAGNWFTFVAAYANIGELAGAGNAALHTALFLVSRRLPYLLLFPVTGLAADSLNRGGLLVASCLVQSAISFLLPFVRLYGRLELLYPLILLQYSAQAFYDPARIASVPAVVPPAMLCVASTLDLMGFSLMAIFGAAAAGRTAAVYGTAVCFRVEGCAFLLAAVLLLRLAARPVGQSRPPGPAANRPVRAVPGSDPSCSAADGRSDGGLKAGCSGHGQGDGRCFPYGDVAAAVAAAPGDGDDANKPPELQPLLSPPLPPAEGRDGRGGSRGRRSAGCGGCGALSYLAQRRNWDVAVLVWCKTSGALVWGAADVLNGRFSRMSAMQTLGGPDVTLGAVLGAVGLGSVLGPVIANGLTPGVARWWRVSITAAFGLLAAGYGIMASATSIGGVLPATAIRTAGSATVFVHSTAILQHRLPDELRGRLFAVEFVMWTVSEATSTLMGGYALDELGWSTHRLCVVLALIAVLFASLWSCNAWVLWRTDRLRDGPLGQALLPVPASDEDLGSSGGENHVAVDVT